jgi:hypothetical protein
MRANGIRKRRYIRLLYPFLDYALTVGELD